MSETRQQLHPEGLSPDSNQELLRRGQSIQELYNFRRTLRGELADDTVEQKAGQLTSILQDLGSPQAEEAAAALRSNAQDEDSLGDFMRNLRKLEDAFRGQYLEQAPFSSVEDVRSMLEAISEEERFSDLRDVICKKVEVYLREQEKHSSGKEPFVDGKEVREKARAQRDFEKEQTGRMVEILEDIEGYGEAVSTPDEVPEDIAKVQAETAGAVSLERVNLDAVPDLEKIFAEKYAMLQQFLADFLVYDRNLENSQLNERIQQEVMKRSSDEARQKQVFNQMAKFNLWSRTAGRDIFECLADADTSIEFADLIGRERAFDMASQICEKALDMKTARGQSKTTPEQKEAPKPAIVAQCAVQTEPDAEGNVSDADINEITDPFFEEHLAPKLPEAELMRLYKLVPAVNEMLGNIYKFNTGWQENPPRLELAAKDDDYVIYIRGGTTDYSDTWDQQYNESFEQLRQYGENASLEITRKKFQGEGMASGGLGIPMLASLKVADNIDAKASFEGGENCITITFGMAAPEEAIGSPS